NENEVVNYFMLKNRSRQFEQIIDRNNLRLLVKLLKQGKIIWYAGDQDMGKKQSVFAPFFGYPAATLTALSRLVRLTQAEV
ncbi:MAG TPA: lipid A biosynthesis lauroyl acyltransferase, partial [Gammaproteobacteria bacterium]|nr:lipid A biosynthesis lauroyl acyltransferase [Gammaproteobacteria bacterium]